MPVTNLGYALRDIRFVLSSKRRSTLTLYFGEPVQETPAEWLFPEALQSLELIQDATVDLPITIEAYGLELILLTRTKNSVRYGKTSLLGYTRMRALDLNYNSTTNSLTIKSYTRNLSTALKELKERSEESLGK